MSAMADPWRIERPGHVQETGAVMPVHGLQLSCRQPGSGTKKACEKAGEGVDKGKWIVYYKKRSFYIENK